MTKPPSRWPIPTGMLIAAALTVAALSAARAESFKFRALWLPRADSLAAALKSRPREYLELRGLSREARFRVELGAVLFRSPQLLGLEARRIGMSCDTCHTGGDVNRGFFIPGLSSRKRTVDLTSLAFHRPADDGKVNPLRIPSLRGIARTAPYGHRGRFPTLEAFTRHVVEDEFGGVPLKPTAMEALVAYMKALKPAPNRYLRADGRLSGLASPTMRRGERVFLRDPSARGARSCAECHAPGRAFTDGRQHDVGTGARIDTPSLLLLAPPYMHDGRYRSLRQVARNFRRHFRRWIVPGSRRELMAYLRAVRHVDRHEEPVTLAADLKRVARAEAVLEGLLRRRQAALAGIVIGTIRRDLGAVHERFPGRQHADARFVLVEWSRAMQPVRRAAEAGEYERALTALKKPAADKPKWRALLEAAEPRSLYNPARLDAFLAARRR